MAWLGSPLADDAQWGSTGFSPRCEKDRIEEKLFARRRDLFTPLQVVFFDTTSMYFEGEGGSELGRYGKSKDHRPDRKQLVAGAILDGNGTPVCSEIWPGNTADVKSLLPIVDRLRARFGVGEVCVVCDRGMISKKTIEELERRNMKYILGARMRAQNEVKRDVLGRGGSFEEIRGPREKAKDPSPLKVKEVIVEDRRYVLCLNEEQARKDAADREAILAGLKDALKRGGKSLVGNKGYRRFLKSSGSFVIDAAKVKAEARYDGKWVLRTNLDLPTKDVALRYKELWMVEDTFRTMKSILDTRPIYHKCDETIRGHVFCSFLALALQKELRKRLNARGLGTVVEWDRLKRDLVALEEVEQDFNGKTFVVRTETVGDCGRALQAVGAAMPPTVRLKESG
jgi:transposase